MNVDTEFRETLARVAKVVRRIIGAPDYEGYLAHARTCHPGEELLSEDAFAKDVLTRRYNKPGNRCC
ncbi:MAG: YbdD/YjiX family protein [bacterium]